MQLSDLKAWIEEQKPIFTKTLEDLVNLNTYTDNKIGVDQGMDMFCKTAETMGFSVEVIHGRHRLIKGGNGKGNRILLIAHMDTVHPPDGDFLSYEPQADGYVHGPGVGDIKGGLLMGLWTIAAIQQLTEDFDLQLVVSADEEKGSPTIRDWYLAGKSEAKYALGLEPGFPQGELTPDVTMGVVRQRKGSGRVRFALKGVASHAGGAWEKGLSALEAMSHRIQKIHALTNLERGITTNVGTVKGGTAANTIAEHCEALIDFRYLTQADGEETLQAIHDIIYEQTTYNPVLDQWEQVSDYEVMVFMPPMEQTNQSEYLIDVVMKEAERLNQSITPIVRGGGSDANYTCGGGIPSICGMGAPAQGIHTTDEKILLPMLFDRLELLISTVYRLNTNGHG